MEHYNDSLRKSTIITLNGDAKSALESLIEHIKFLENKASLNLGINFDQIIFRKRSS